MNNSFAAHHPELVCEWSDRNLPLTPDRITYGSNKRVWWKLTAGMNGRPASKAVLPERNVRFVQKQELLRVSMIWQLWSQSWPANGQRRIS